MKDYVAGVITILLIAAVALLAQDLWVQDPDPGPFQPPVIGASFSHHNGIAFPAQSTLTIANGTGGISPTGTYQPLTAGGAVGNTMAVTGFEQGDVVNLINTSANAITITDTGTTMLSGNAVLGQYDTLTLWFDGTNWIEIAQANN